MTGVAVVRRSTRCAQVAHHQIAVIPPSLLRTHAYCLSTANDRRSPTEVRAVLDDFGGVENYNPSVESSSIVDGPDTGTGATRACSFSDGGRVEERIVEYDPGERYVVEFVDLEEMPLTRNVVEIAVDEPEPGRTTVEMTATFAPEYGPLAWVMAKLVMRSKFEETFEGVLDGLASYVEAGADAGSVDATAD